MPGQRDQGECTALNEKQEHTDMDRRAGHQKPLTEKPGFSIPPPTWRDLGQLEEVGILELRQEGRRKEGIYRQRERCSENDGAVGDLGGPL